MERIGEDDPEEEEIFRDLWEDETQREVMIESLKADCVVRRGEALRVFESHKDLRRPLAYLWRVSRM